MSCNGCRVLRKGCSEECLLRDGLKWIEKAEEQGHATLFVAKFFGRSTLMSFLSSVPPNQRSGLFRSLVYEAVGRTVNPVNGAVGLLWTGNWHLCQLGVDKLLKGAAFIHHHHRYSQHRSFRMTRRHNNKQIKKKPSQLLELPTTTTTASASQTNLLPLFLSPSL